MNTTYQKLLIAGNWKMNLNEAEAMYLAAETNGSSAVDVLICPSYIYLSSIHGIIEKDNIYLGAQDCSAEEEGAFTGDISASMVTDMGCKFVILGHSERRTIHHENDLLIATKANRAYKAGLIPIICVGETLEQREAGQEEAVIHAQLEQSIPQDIAADPNAELVIAYEPVWAIGTGKTAKTSDVEAMHKFIANYCAERLANYQSLRILYGGSVKPDNAKELLSLPHVSGALIGGASLKAESFNAIIAEANSL